MTKQTANRSCAAQLSGRSRISGSLILRLPFKNLAQVSARHPACNCNRAFRHATSCPPSKQLAQPFTINQLTRFGRTPQLLITSCMTCRDSRHVQILLAKECRVLFLFLCAVPCATRGDPGARSLALGHMSCLRVCPAQCHHPDKPHQLLCQKRFLGL